MLNLTKLKHYNAVIIEITNPKNSHIIQDILRRLYGNDMFRTNYDEVKSLYIEKLLSSYYISWSESLYHRRSKNTLKETYKHYKVFTDVQFLAKIKPISITT